MLCISHVKIMASSYTIRIIGMIGAKGLKKMKNEKDLILSDVIICAVLKIEADAVGVPLEEYVDRFLEVFYNEPHMLQPILSHQ